MAESWSKTLRCPICGREGEALMSHAEDLTGKAEAKTLVDACPSGFEVRQDEDDSNIVRFFCAADGASADQ